jgi:hypothetical protein
VPKTSKKVSTLSSRLLQQADEQKKALLGENKPKIVSYTKPQKAEHFQ